MGAGPRRRALTLAYGRPGVPHDRFVSEMAPVPFRPMYRSDASIALGLGGATRAALRRMVSSDVVMPMVMMKMVMTRVGVSLGDSGSRQISCGEHQ